MSLIASERAAAPVREPVRAATPVANEAPAWPGVGFSDVFCGELDSAAAEGGTRRRKQSVAAIAAARTSRT